MLAWLGQTLAVASGTPYGVLASRKVAADASSSVALSSQSLAAGQSAFKATIERAHADRAKAFRGFLTRYLKARLAKGRGMR